MRWEPPYHQFLALKVRRRDGLALPQCEQCRESGTLVPERSQLFVVTTHRVFDHVLQGAKRQVDARSHGRSRRIAARARAASARTSPHVAPPSPRTVRAAPPRCSRSAVTPRVAVSAHPWTNPHPTWRRRDSSDPAPTATGSFLLPERPSTAYLRPRRARAAAPSSRASYRSPRARRARRGAASFRRSPPSARRCDCGETRRARSVTAQTTATDRTLRRFTPSSGSASRRWRSRTGSTRRSCRTRTRTRTRARIAEPVDSRRRRRGRDCGRSTRGTRRFER